MVSLEMVDSLRNAFLKKTDGVINVKVEFGEGEGKVSLDNIAKRVEAYKPKELVC